MKTSIQSIHFDADVRLLQQIHEKMKRLTKFVQDRAIEAKVILKLEKVGQIQDKVIEVIIRMPGIDMVAKSTHKSFEVALTEVIAIIKKQLLKHKEKIQKKH